MDVLQLIIKYHVALLRGVGVTLKLSLIVWVLGLVIGGALGFAGAQLPKTWGRVVQFISFIVVSTPVLVILFWLYYPAQTITGLNLSPFQTAALAFSIVNVVAVADAVRDALREFPNEYMLAAKVCGLSRMQAWWHVELPLVLRRLVGPLLLIQVYMLQSTLFASLISVGEIFRVSQEINSVEYQPVAIYTGLAIFFWILCVPLNGAALALKRKYRHTLAER